MLPRTFKKPRAKRRTKTIEREEAVRPPMSLLRFRMEPDSDLRDEMLAKFEKFIQKIPPSGRGALALLVKIAAWEKRAAKKYKWTVEKRTAAGKLKNVTLKDPFFGRYVCILHAAGDMLANGVAFDLKTVYFLMPYVANAFLSVPTEGWVNPAKRLQDLNELSEALVKSCPVLVEQTPDREAPPREEAPRSQIEERADENERRIQEEARHFQGELPPATIGRSSPEEASRDRQRRTSPQDFDERRVPPRHDYRVHPPQHDYQDHSPRRHESAPVRHDESRVPPSSRFSGLFPAKREAALSSREERPMGSQRPPASRRPEPKKPLWERTDEDEGYEEGGDDE